MLNQIKKGEKYYDDLKWIIKAKSRTTAPFNLLWIKTDSEGEKYLACSDSRRIHIAYFDSIFEPGEYEISTEKNIIILNKTECQTPDCQRFIDAKVDEWIFEFFDTDDQTISTALCRLIRRTAGIGFNFTFLKDAAVKNMKMFINPDGGFNPIKLVKDNKIALIMPFVMEK